MITCPGNHGGRRERSPNRTGEDQAGHIVGVERVDREARHSDASCAIYLGQACGIEYDDLALHWPRDLQISLSLISGNCARYRLEGEAEIISNIAAGHWKRYGAS